MNPSNLPLQAEDIKKLIPQRFPFLMIDRVIEASPEKVVAIKNVSANEHFFVGHFPEAKVMPGVLIIEAMAQAGIVLHRQKFRDDKILFLGSVKARFFKPVMAGDQIRIEAVPVKMLSKMGIFHAVAYVNKMKLCPDGTVGAVSFDTVQSETPHRPAQSGTGAWVKAAEAEIAFGSEDARIA